MDKKKFEKKKSIIVRNGLSFILGPYNQLICCAMFHLTPLKMVSIIIQYIVSEVNKNSNCKALSARSIIINTCLAIGNFSYSKKRSKTSWTINIEDLVIDDTNISKEIQQSSLENLDLIRL